MVRKNRKRNKKAALKAKGKAEPEKPNNGVKGVPKELSEPVDGSKEELKVVEKPEELVAALKDDPVIAEVLEDILDEVEKIEKIQKDQLEDLEDLDLIDVLEKTNGENEIETNQLEDLKAWEDSEELLKNDPLFPQFLEDILDEVETPEELAALMKDHPLVAEILKDIVEEVKKIKKDQLKDSKAGEDSEELPNDDVVMTRIMMSILNEVKEDMKIGIDQSAEQEDLTEETESELESESEDVETPNVSATDLNPIEKDEVKDPKIKEILVEDLESPAKESEDPEVKDAKDPFESMDPEVEKMVDQLIPKGGDEEKRKALADMVSKFLAMDSSDEETLEEYSEKGSEKDSEEDSEKNSENDSDKDSEEDSDEDSDGDLKKDVRNRTYRTRSEISSSSWYESSTTTISESSDEEEDMNFLNKLIEKHGRKGADELLSSLLVPLHKRFPMIPPVSPVPQESRSLDSKDISSKSTKASKNPKKQLPMNLVETPSASNVQPFSKKLRETGQLATRSKPPPSTTPIVRPPVPQATSMSSFDDDEDLFPELSSTRTARWVEASRTGRDPNDYVERVMAKKEKRQPMNLSQAKARAAAATASVIKPVVKKSFPTTQKLAPPPKIIRPRASETLIEKPKSPIPTSTPEVTSDLEDPEPYEETIVIKRHRVKTKKFAPSMRFKRVELPDSFYFNGSDEFEKSLLSTGSESSVEESDQGSEKDLLISEHSDAGSIVRTEQSYSDSDVPKEKVSRGRKYQGLDQDDGWKASRKQDYDWNIRSWSGLIAVIVALFAMSNYFGSSEPSRVTRDAPQNIPDKSFDPILHKSALLARLMNGIYLQNQLTNGTFPTYDFVAEAGGIGDPSMINKTMNLGAQGAVTRMAAIRVLNVIIPEGVGDKLNTLSKFTSAKPPNVVDKTQTDTVFTSVATLKTAIPAVFAETEVDSILDTVNKLDGALGTEVGNLLSGKIAFIHGAISVFESSFLKNRLNPFITGDTLSQVEGFGKTVDTFLERVKFDEDFIKARGELTELDSNMADVRTQADVVDPFMIEKQNIDTLATLKTLHDFLKAIDDHLPRNLLIAFPKSPSIIGNFTADFANSWLRKVLNEKNSLSVLEKTLEPLVNATKQVEAVVNSWETGTRSTLVQTITADRKKLGMMMAVKPKSESISKSADDITSLLSSLTPVSDFTGSAKLTEMKTKFDELATLTSAFIKEATTLEKDPKFMFFINKDLAPLQASIKNEQDPTTAKTKLDNNEELKAIRSNSQYVSTKMKELNVKATTLVNLLDTLVGYQSNLNDARSWMTDNEQKDFFAMVPAVNKDIRIVQRMFDLAPKATTQTRRKRDASVQLMALADALDKLKPLKDAVDKLKDPSKKNKKTVELKKLSSARQMAEELAYATGALNAYSAIQKNPADITTITNFAKAVDAEIAKLNPQDQAEVRVGWPGADNVIATFTALAPEVKKLPAALDKVKADATLNDFAEVLAVLDKIPVLKLDVIAILKSLEILKTKSKNAQPVVDVSTALKKFEGLSFASGRKKGALPAMVKKIHAFFFDFFGLVIPTTTEAPISYTEIPFFIIIFFIASLPGGIWLFLWFRWVRKLKRAYRKLPTEEQKATKTAKSIKEEAKKSLKEPVVEPAKKKSDVHLPSEGDPMAVEQKDDPPAVEKKDEEENDIEKQELEAKMREKRLARAAKKLDADAQWAKADKRFRRREDRKKEVIRRKKQKLEKRRRAALKTAVKAKTIYVVDKNHKSYWFRRPDLAPVLVWKKKIKLKKKKKGKKSKVTLYDEEPIWHKVPFNDLTPIPSLISYNSDDLRSANTDTDSTGLPLTQWQGSTCSDRTQKGDNERVLRQDEMWQGDHIAKARQWQNIINSWATTNLEKLQGFKSAGHYKAYRNWITRLKQKIADMEAKEEELRNEIAYNRTADKWKAMLAENADEIKVKKLEYKKAADEDAEEERKNTEILMKLKKARTPAQNVEKYISESYSEDPDREYCIVEIAFRSVDPIDNFILSYKHDRYEHLFRTHTSKYVHDWARMRFTVDSPYDYEYYDAGIIYPWGEHFEEILVENKYNNLIAVASAPMFPQASAIFWHMMFCNRVPMLVMLNQMVERTFQTVDPFFPLRPKEEKRFKYNKRREYIVKCLEIKKVYKKNGIERLLEITPIVDRQRGPALLMVFIHMLDWPQEGMPRKWKNYVDLCERIKDMSTNNPVMLMSMHGCGRAATLACTLMAAILVPLEDDLGVHVMVHGARATKRSSMTCELQVYFWRMVSYELLFRWFPETRKYRKHMEDRDAVYEDAIVGYTIEYADTQDEFFELMYTWEYDRFDRHYFASRHMRKMLKMKRRLNLEKVQCHLYQAREAQEALDEHAPYRNGEIIRRKFLRAWDPPRDPNRKKRVYVEDDILKKAPMERTQAKLGIYPLLCKYRPTGLYRWIYPSKQKEIDAKGMPQPGNYKEFCHMTEANKAEWERRRKRQRLLNPKVIMPPEEWMNVKFLPAKENDRHLLTSKPEEEEPEKERASRWDKWVRPPRHHPRKYFEKTPPREYVPAPPSPGTQPPRAPPPSRAQSEEPKLAPSKSDPSLIYTAPLEPLEVDGLVPVQFPSKAQSPTASKVPKISKVAPVEKSKVSKLAPAAPESKDSKDFKTTNVPAAAPVKESKVPKLAPTTPVAPVMESKAPPTAPLSPAAPNVSKAPKAPAPPTPKGKKGSKPPTKAPAKIPSPAPSKDTKVTPIVPAKASIPAASKAPTTAPVNRSKPAIKAPAKTASPAPSKGGKVASTALPKAPTPAAPIRDSKPTKLTPAAPTKKSKGSKDLKTPAPTPKGSKNKKAPVKTPAKAASKGPKAKK